MMNNELTGNQSDILRTVHNLRGKADLASLHVRYDNVTVDLDVLITSGLVEMTALGSIVLTSAGAALFGQHSNPVAR